MGLTPSQRRNRRLAAGTALAAVIAAGALGLGIFAKSSDGGATASSIPALVPADADTVVIAPFSEKWWDKVAPMDEPNKKLPELKPAAADLAIENIGYSRSQDTEDHGTPFALPLRLFYVESPTQEDAEKVADWLEHQAASENRTVTVEGDVVVVGSSINSFKPPAESILTLDTYDPDQPADAATMWMNTGREAVSLTGDGDSREARAYADVLANGFGFETGTKWMGTSTDGESWAGEFAAGGVNPESIDFKKAVESLAATEEVLAEVDGPTGKAEVIKPGVGAILDSASFVAGTKHMGTPLETAGTASVKDPLITVTNDVTSWDASISGIQMANENLAERNISANADEMVLSYSYRK
ncbi:hypothetical protein [Arthrobacter sp. zg-Y1110]|uniref:hypothetical protein n=1 Tax=Arthrobacter sp. zg-Y1110 TaxID=2886932 RepID=UPI001D136EF7|nr:hypothetical protein [Arthrobacter sp. zg-Y1110]MCC3292580.1 hypothetical protein [Arthrobacter sp. zg-Y1110]UWX86987.1 hypothetical protein N2K99_16690 [Arthrobacter sp. zg-Y1110]